MAVLNIVIILLLFSKVVDSQAAGATCGTNTACNSGLTCENTFCKLNPGETCTSTSDTNCKSGTTCDGTKCKLNPGGVCTSSSGNAANCKSGTTCDGTACKINVGLTCEGFTSDCSSGSSCDTGNLCKLNPGGVCTTASGNAATCKSGTTCDGSSCKLNVGQNCTGFTSQCTSGATCDAGNVCIVDSQAAGATCGTNSACNSGLTCENTLRITDNTYGGTCAINGTVDSCITPGGDVNAVCALTLKYACKSGYTGSLGAKCSGAASLASSLVILIAAIFAKHTWSNDDIRITSDTDSL